MSATPRKICPVLTAGTVKTQSIIGADGTTPGAQVTPIQCIGPECHLWRHDERLPPETGDCTYALTGLFTATTAQQVADVVNNTAAIGEVLKLIAKQAGVQITDHPQFAPPTA